MGSRSLQEVLFGESTPPELSVPAEGIPKPDRKGLIQKGVR